jgi:hypothetical protein
MGKSLAVALALAASAAARAQQDEVGGNTRGVNTDRENAQAGNAQRDRQAAAGGTSDLFDRACIDLLHGKMPRDEQAIRALKDACGKLMAGRADERLRDEQQRKAAASARQARVDPSRSANQPQQGGGVLAAFQEAGREFSGPQRNANIGYVRGGPVGYTLVTNPVGWFSGLGVNAELSHPIDPRFSWVLGARYSATDVANGTASTFGVMGGVDLFVLGQNNAGLRIGPRMELAAGRERVSDSSTTFARLGLAGEVGYNYIASNGVTATVAGGVGGRVAGDSQNESFASFVGGEFGPYLKLGLGWSW